MKLLSKDDYLTFMESRDSVLIEDVEVRLVKRRNIKTFEPENYSTEEFTVWSFPARGDWATHLGNYRGNWSPFVPRNLIDRYTRAGDLVCDPMMGSGTTLVECRLTGRSAIGVDINSNACMVAMNRLDFDTGENQRDRLKPRIEVYHGDARNLDLIQNEVVDLIATHPPYAGIISYSKGQIPGDLSGLDLHYFIEEMGIVAESCFRVLKPGKFCAILVGGTRKHGHYVPIHIGVLAKFLGAGFILNEEIIKLQHNTMSMAKRWTNVTCGFYKIAHEHLYVFRKPNKNESSAGLEYSKKWW
jgi:DNA modification methylase